MFKMMLIRLCVWVLLKIHENPVLLFHPFNIDGLPVEVARKYLQEDFLKILPRARALYRRFREELKDQEPHIVRNRVTGQLLKDYPETHVDMIEKIWNRVKAE